MKRNCLIVVVNNSTNVNKTNKPLKKRKRPQHLALEIQVLDWNRHKNMTGINQLMASHPSHFDTWILNNKTDINKR